MPEVQDYSDRPKVVEAVEKARDTIIACWSEWEADAGQDAQNQQSNEAWFDAMNAQLECVLFGMLDEVLPIIHGTEARQ